MKRLRAVLELLPKCKILADVGCDHGLLSRAALIAGKAEKVYACDIGERPLEKARRNLRGRNAEFFLSDGLKNVPKDMDCIAVCGMGGKTIIDVLSGYTGDAALVLQPQGMSREVRLFLSSTLGYAIEREKTVCERGRYYTVISAVKGSRALDELELEFGTEAHNPTAELRAYCEKTIKALSKNVILSDGAKSRCLAAEAILKQK